MNNKKNLAFSLVELMVVLSIVSIVLALALPKYTQFKIRAGQLEAKTIVKHLSTLQVVHFSEKNTYGSLGSTGYTNFGGSPTCHSSKNSDAEELSLTHVLAVNDLGFRMTGNPCNSRFIASSITSTTGAHYEIVVHNLLSDSHQNGRGYGLSSAQCQDYYEDYFVLTDKGATVTTANDWAIGYGSLDRCK